MKLKTFIMSAAFAVSAFAGPASADSKTLIDDYGIEWCEYDSANKYNTCDRQCRVGKKHSAFIEDAVDKCRKFRGRLGNITDEQIECQQSRIKSSVYECLCDCAFDRE